MKWKDLPIGKPLTHCRFIIFLHPHLWHIFGQEFHNHISEGERHHIWTLVEMSGSLKLWALWKEVILHHGLHRRQGTYSSFTQNKTYFYGKTKSHACIRRAGRRRKCVFNKHPHPASGRPQLRSKLRRVQWLLFKIIIIIIELHLLGVWFNP